MDTIDLIKNLVKEKGGKIILVVLDGLGGLPINGKTELASAHKPNIDNLLKDSSCGLITPVLPGLTPGSGPGHLALFGYNPLKFDIGRGILEALGVDMEVLPGDITARGNFCTIKDGIVVDRRAGRIPDEKNRELIGLLSSRIKEIDGVKVILKSGKEHRFVLLFRGNLKGSCTDTDPHLEGNPVLESKPLNDGERLAGIVNKFTRSAIEVLKDSYPANGVLIRGITGAPDIPQFPEIYKMRSIAIATYPMYRGIAKLLGMDIASFDGQDIKDEINELKNKYEDYDFFFVHIKKTDSYGEDGNFDEKVKVIERFDEFIPEILSLKPDVLAITGDHSTPSKYHAHSWHPVPILIHSKWTRRHNATSFNETECLKGDLGIFEARYIMPILLSNAGRLDKFGA